MFSGNNPQAERKALIPVRHVVRTVIVLLLLTVARGQVPSATEYQIKAAFLYNFTKFVEWPADAFKTPDAVVQICILGDNPFGQELDNLIQNKTVNGREVRVQQLRRVRDVHNCHIVFVSRGESPQLTQILEELRGGSVLTVSDIPGFTARGGMINFVLDKDRVRLEVNDKAASQVRLKISSKVLSLARSVIE